MRNLLGGKGANLAEMNLMGMPVPPGFTITTEVCAEYTQLGHAMPLSMTSKAEVEKAIAHVENLTGKKFDDPANPLLVSVRSGARASMPGMMDTVLNLGMNDATVATMAEKAAIPLRMGQLSPLRADVRRRRCARHEAEKQNRHRSLQGGHHGPGEGGKGVKFDNELNVDDFKELVVRFKKAVKEYTGKDFPESALGTALGRYLRRFRQLDERTRHNLSPHESDSRGNGELPSTCRPWYMETWVTTPPPGWLSAVTPQPVRTFSTENISSTPRARMSWPVSALPSRSPSEGSRRWAALQGISEDERRMKYPLSRNPCHPRRRAHSRQPISSKDHYRDMQDMEFTIQDGKLWMLQEPVTASVPAPLWYASLWTSSAKT